eukprot:CAMPEP_0201242872 /NCGR_PEP_ID=MMETSP0852-20130820/39502_1 /ASSEMBLY_ACC=CAM_ASM_000632 /TAXON_ID=183588 /ORGANISM="Pseudo-nitzschia fraudulenta, Strain WWA7" /LENGTH=300 /DNA_ID=CAMNT_0047539713 /DNA_START=41 /DNA_END=943 /DNA_ORIENTATION=-
MPFVKVDLYSVLLLLSSILSSRAFMGDLSGKQQQPVNNEMRPDLYDIVDQTDSAQLNIQLHVGNEESGFLTIQDMIIGLGGRCTEEDGDAMVKLPGSSGPYSKVTSGGRRLDVVSRGTYVNMDGSQYIECEKGCWEMCWMRGQPAGTIVFAFNLPQAYSRNEAVLPEGEMWLSFPVWTVEGLKYGQMAKQEVLDEMDFYTRKWNEEVDKYEITNNPIMKAIHERNAHIYATKCDDLYDYSLDTIPEDGEWSTLQEDLLLSKKGLIWKKDGNGDVLLGHAIASPFVKETKLSSFSTGRLRP